MCVFTNYCRIEWGNFALFAIVSFEACFHFFGYYVLSIVFDLAYTVFISYTRILCFPYRIEEARRGAPDDWELERNICFSLRRFLRNFGRLSDGCLQFTIFIHMRGIILERVSDILDRWYVWIFFFFIKCRNFK